MTEVRVALFAEDRNFVDFLVPVVEVVGGKLGRRVVWHVREPLHGCRARLLKDRIEHEVSRVDLVVVGADAAGRDHASRGKGHRRKRSELRDWLDDDTRVVVAVADPCVEAWLYCHPKGFSRALENALATRFTMPSTWPVPKSEAEAKDQLGRLIATGLDADLARNGFEFASEIVASLLVETAQPQALRECVQDLTQAMASIA